MVVFGEQVYQDIILLAVGDNNRDAFVGYLLRDVAFSQHTAATER